YFFFQAEDGIRDDLVTGVQTCALPIYPEHIGVMVVPGTSPHVLRVAFAHAHVEVERAIPPIHSYLVRVAPARQEAAVRALRASQIGRASCREREQDAGCAES